MRQRKRWEKEMGERERKRMGVHPWRETEEEMGRRDGRERKKEDGGTFVERDREKTQKRERRRDGEGV